MPLATVSLSFIPSFYFYSALQATTPSSGRANRASHVEPATAAMLPPSGQMLLWLGRPVPFPAFALLCHIINTLLVFFRKCRVVSATLGYLQRGRETGRKGNMQAHILTIPVCLFVRYLRAVFSNLFRFDLTVAARHPITAYYYIYM